MRVRVNRQISMFVAIDLEKRILANHPPRTAKRGVDEIRFPMRGDFAAAHGTTSRLGIPPEQLLQAMPLRARSTPSRASGGSRRRSSSASSTAGLWIWSRTRPGGAPRCSA